MNEFITGLLSVFNLQVLGKVAAVVIVVILFYSLIWGSDWIRNQLKERKKRGTK